MVEAALREGSEVCASVTGRPVDLVDRVRQRRETCDLSSYAEDVALIVSVSLAQVRLLEECFGVPFKHAKLTFGYSLGEASALIATGMYSLPDILRVPLAMAADSVELARDVTMGVLFSRGRALDLMAVQRFCQEINNHGDGVIGVSSILSPNCILLLGQRSTIDQFAARMKERLTGAVGVRQNPDPWPARHAPITWPRASRNRVADMMPATPGGMGPPTVPIISGVTGKTDVTADNSRELIHQWVDHPQRLWDQIVCVLSAGVRTVVHVGPSPNLIPATFTRLAEDVRGQLNRRSAAGVRQPLARPRGPRPWEGAVRGLPPA